MLNSKQVGNITEIKCILAFLEQGYNVLTPYGDCERYDFVADIKGNLVRIQVKTSKLAKRGNGFSFSTRSSNRQNGAILHHQYTKEEIDFFATSYQDKCYLVPVEECGAAKTLRLDPPENGQRYSMAEDYELEVMLKRYYG